MKIVLDTNILISFLVGNENASKLLDYLSKSDISIVADSRLFHEYVIIQNRSKFDKSSINRSALNSFIEKNIQIVPVSTPIVKFNPDRQDSKLIETANSAKCDYIITNDKPLLNRASHLTSAKLINCDDFVEMISKLEKW